jgi:hypothetical protein
MNNYHFCVILLRFQPCNYTNIEELQPPSSSPSTIKKSNNDSHTGPIEAQRILVQLRRRKTLVRKTAFLAFFSVRPRPSLCPSLSWSSASIPIFKFNREYFLESRDAMPRGKLLRTRNLRISASKERGLPRLTLRQSINSCNTLNPKRPTFH